MFATDVSQYIDVGALVKILLIALVAGAGLTAVFSFGVAGLSRGLPRVGSRGGSGAGEGRGDAARNPAALVVAVLCFLVVLAGIGYGISVALTK
jgi:hypothetical protein